VAVEVRLEVDVSVAVEVRLEVDVKVDVSVDVHGSTQLEPSTHASRVVMHE
jgi:hypothetical protein